MKFSYQLIISRTNSEREKREKLSTEKEGNGLNCEDTLKKKGTCSSATDPLQCILVDYVTVQLHHPINALIMAGDSQ